MGRASMRMAVRLRGGSGGVARPMLARPNRYLLPSDSTLNGPVAHATMRPMQLDDRFEDLVASLGGFYRTWYVATGLELGLLAQLRDAGKAGLTIAELARRARTSPDVTGRWAWGAAAHDLVELVDDRVTLPADVGAILLDPDRPEHLGGQFQFAATGSLDFGGLPELFRTGQPPGRGPIATGSPSSGSPSRTSPCSSRRSCRRCRSWSPTSRPAAGSSTSTAVAAGG